MIEKNQSRFTALPAILPALGTRRAAVALLSTTALMSLGMLYPATAQAGIFDGFRQMLEGKAEAAPAPEGKSVQTMSLPKPAMNIDPNPAKGGAEVSIEEGAAARAQGGFSGETVAPSKDAISIYVVREGDTLSEIAEMFGVTVNTIIWANDLPVRGSVKVGQRLTILPVTGVKYTVKKGDTLASIAKEFHGDANEIAQYNDIVGELAVGADILIPNGEVAQPQVAATPKTAPAAQSTSASYSGYYQRPVAGGTRTQGIHGYNGIDIAASIGTPVVASAGGEVIIARAGGWNGGYGSYVVIRHDNGSQSLYAHMSAVHVGVGEVVSKGALVGAVGNSGKSTGPHLHFEIRGGPRNPF